MREVLNRNHAGDVYSGGRGSCGKLGDFEAGACSGLHYYGGNNCYGYGGNGTFVTVGYPQGQNEGGEP